MSEIRNLIKETNKTTRTGRRINNILWVIVTVFVILSVYTTMLAIDSKNEAEDFYKMQKKTGVQNCEPLPNVFIRKDDYFNNCRKTICKMPPLR